MDPLSAFKLPISPALNAGALNQAGLEKLGKMIPSGELENLYKDKMAGGMMPISTDRAGSPISIPQSQGNSFGNVLGQMVNDVNAKQGMAGNAVNGLITENNVSLHQAMIAMEEASVSFQLMVEVRNKLLESYQELMRMQI